MQEAEPLAGLATGRVEYSLETSIAPASVYRWRHHLRLVVLPLVGWGGPVLPGQTLGFNPSPSRKRATGAPAQPKPISTVEPLHGGCTRASCSATFMAFRANCPVDQSCGGVGGGDYPNGVTVQFVDLDDRRSVAGCRSSGQSDDRVKSVPAGRAGGRDLSCRLGSGFQDIGGECVRRHRDDRCARHRRRGERTGHRVRLGFDSDGALGDGTTTNGSTPVRVRGLTGVTAIAGGYFSGYALRSNGTVYAWGLQRLRPTRRRHHHRQEHPGSGPRPDRRHRHRRRRRQRICPAQQRHRLRLGFQRFGPARRRHHHRQAHPGSGPRPDRRHRHRRRHTTAVMPCAATAPSTPGVATTSANSATAPPPTGSPRFGSAA